MRVYKLLNMDYDIQDDYLFYISVSKPCDNFKMYFKKYKAKPVINFSFKDVDYIKRLFFEGSLSSIFEILSMQYGCSVKTILFLRIGKLLSVIRNLQIEIEHLINEDDKLDQFTDQKVKMALKMSKSDVMNQFGIYNSIDSLANNDKSKWEMFENMPYYKVKFMLTFDTVSNSVNKRFQKNYNELIKLEK